MNIAFFVDTYEPQINGVVTVVKQLKLDLERLGCTVYVITPRRANSKPLPCVFYLDARPSQIGKNEYIPTVKYQIIVDFCRDHHIDILHAHSEFRIARLAIKAARELHLPFVITFHTFWKHYIRAYVPLWFLVPKSTVDIYTKYVYKNAVAIYAVSKKVQSYLSSKKMLPDKNIILIENAIDRAAVCNQESAEESKKNIAEIKSKYGITDDMMVLLYFGRVSHEKRIRELLKILNTVRVQTSKSIKLLILGGGPGMDDLSEYSKKLKLDDIVVFTGFIQRAHLIDYFKISKLFVSTSISETYSMTVTEALSAGLPVLLREDSCYFDRVINGKNGIMAKTDKEFASALSDLIANPEKLQALKENCGSKKEEKPYTSLDQAKKYLDSYEEILANWNPDNSSR